MLLSLRHADALVSEALYISIDLGCLRCNSIQMEIFKVENNIK